MSSWVLDYVSAMDPVSEAPLQYNLWAAISVVSSVLKRNVWLNYKTFTIYPNHYIVLVGPPGVGKGTAIHPAHEFAKECQAVNYISDRVTAPRIIEKLNQGFTPAPKMQGSQVILGGKDSTATLMSSELHVLLSSSEWMLDFLCDVWDKGEYAYDTKGSGSYTVKDLGVGLIGACVPNYIIKVNRDAFSTISSGFSARTIFVNAKAKSKSLSWGDGLRNDKTKAHLVKDLQLKLEAISKLRGEFTLDPIARARWDLWYKEHEDNASPDETDVYKNFHARVPTHVLKLAMVLCASDPVAGAKLVINRGILETAIKYIESVAEGVDEIFRGVGESDVSAAIARLQLYIERKQSVGYNDLLNDNIRHINHDDIVKVLKILQLIGFVTEEQRSNIYWYVHTGKPINSNTKVRVRP